MSTQTDKLPFKQISFEAKESVDKKITGFNEVQSVFKHMVNFLHNYFDIPILDLEKSIK